MKIEKINDSKIRCTLTGDDLEAMNINLTDLILKKDKSRALFDDILEAAFIEFNFKPGEAPMMIEAIPNDDNSVILTFTIVDRAAAQNSPLADLLSSEQAGAKASPDLGSLLGTDDTQDISSNIYSFKTIDDVIDAVGIIHSNFTEKSNLHFDKANNLFILTIFQCDLCPDLFFKISNTLCEFSVLEICNPLSIAYLNEYCQSIVLGNAIEVIGSI